MKKMWEKLKEMARKACRACGLCKCDKKKSPKKKKKATVNKKTTKKEESSK